jgi:hypothetical protein
MFGSMKIGARVAASLGLLVVFIISLGVYSSQALQQADDSDTLLYEQNALPLGLLLDLVEVRDDASRNTLVAAISDDAVSRAEALGRAELALATADKLFAELDGTVKIDVLRAALAETGARQSPDRHRAQGGHRGNTPGRGRGCGEERVVGATLPHH